MITYDFNACANSIMNWL